MRTRLRTVAALPSGGRRRNEIGSVEPLRHRRDPTLDSLPGRRRPSLAVNSQPKGRSVEAVVASHRSSWRQISSNISSSQLATGTGFAAQTERTWIPERRFPWNKSSPKRRSTAPIVGGRSEELAQEIAHLLAPRRTGAKKPSPNFGRLLLVRVTAYREAKEL